MTVRTRALLKHFLSYQLSFQIWKLLTQYFLLSMYFISPDASAGRRLFHLENNSSSPDVGKHNFGRLDSYWSGYDESLSCWSVKSPEGFPLAFKDPVFFSKPKHTMHTCNSWFNDMSQIIHQVKVQILMQSPVNLLTIDFGDPENDGKHYITLKWNKKRQS